MLLVAPPSRAGVPEELAGFFPVPRVELLGNARLVCSDNDPYCPEGAVTLYGDGVVLPGEGHINPDAGYGPWPSVEAWARGESAVISSRIAPG